MFKINRPHQQNSKSSEKFKHRCVNIKNINVANKPCSAIIPSKIKMCWRQSITDSFTGSETRFIGHCTNHVDLNMYTCSDLPFIRQASIKGVYPSSSWQLIKDFQQSIFSIALTATVLLKIHWISMASFPFLCDLLIYSSPLTGPKIQPMQWQKQNQEFVFCQWVTNWFVSAW